MGFDPDPVPTPKRSIQPFSGSACWASHTWDVGVVCTGGGRSQEGSEAGDAEDWTEGVEMILGVRFWPPGRSCWQEGGT